MDEENGTPITKDDIENKCLDGSFSNILSDVIELGLDDILGRLGQLLGTNVTTENKGLSWQTLGSQVEACTRDLIKQTSKVMLQNLKKRLVDQLTNQTIAWINDDKEPKYVTNFWGFMDETLNAAAGETIRELDLANIPEDMKSALIAGVRQQNQKRKMSVSDLFSQDIGEEINIGSFEEDFTEGGFPGLIALSDPKNNSLGSSYITALISKENEEEALQKEASRKNNDNFKDDLACVKWVLVKTDPNYPDVTSGAYRDPATNRQVILNYTPANARKLSDPPPSNNIPNTKYICLDNPKDNGVIVKTPAGVIQQIAEKAILQQFDYVLSSDDINSYVSRIADASVNTLMRDGIANFGQSAGENSDYLPVGFAQKQQQYNQNFSGEGVQNESKLLVRDNLIPRAEKLITDSSSTLGEILDFERRVNFLQASLFSTSSPVGLLPCMQMRNYTPTNYPAGCNPMFPPPSGNCTIRFTGKTIPALTAELQVLVSQKRAINTARKNEAASVNTGMKEKIVSIRNITEATPLSVVNQLKSDVKNGENSLKKTREDFATFKSDTDPVIDHVSANRNACAGPEGSQ